MRHPRTARSGGQRGFSLIELLVVLAALALLLGVAVPRYVDHVDRAREAVLKQNLNTMRDAIDKFAADRGRLPAELGELVQARYLRAIPLDPVTQRVDTWVGVPAGAPGASGALGAGGVAGLPAISGAAQIADVRSGAPGLSSEGSPYASW